MQRISLRSKRRSIIEGIAWARFGEFHLSLKGLDLFPPSKDLLLLLGKVDTHSDAGWTRASSSLGLRHPITAIIESGSSLGKVQIFVRVSKVTMRSTGGNG